ncbi:MAG: cytochrome c [Spirochaetaceae bacterium]|nr:cytochrome c [Myxococcales bacterium]MCB9726607.1 cytochrome c [Spirochaetaceae bacterium]
MLTKSQARVFFLAGTVFFSAIFILLTIDTLRQVPERQNSEALTASVVRGKHIWDSNNCMGCHTILGEGAYYAPELTRVVERRGAEWIRIFLRDPEAMYPGKRRMVRYGFDEEQITDVIAFLDWIGHVDTNGFPPAPDMAPDVKLTSTAEVQASAARPAYFDTVCIACHAVGGRGGNVGPALDGVAHRMTASELDRWLADPQSVKPGTAMPKLGLADDTRAELVAWLGTLK